MKATLKPLFKKTVLVTVVLIQSLFLSSTVLTQTVFADACPTITGTTAPTGASAPTFSFNAATCLWENDYYTWNPVTKEYAPKYSQAPVYNAETDMWDVIQWDYWPAAGKYVSSVTSSPANLRNKTTASISDTGTGSDNTVNSSNTSNTTVDNEQTATINNFLTSLARSGNATADGNTTVGDISSGDAEAIANLLNMIGSSWDTSNLLMFSADIGHYTGDLLLDPDAVIRNTGTASNNAVNSDDTNNLTVNNTTNSGINNNLTLDSISGNATGNNNTNVGDTTSGDALTELNLFNLINSAIGSDKTFFGTININGNFNGDILLPLGTATNLLSSTGTGSTNSINQDNTNNLTVTDDRNNSIDNNINLVATSGDVDGSGNTTAGNLRTGDASTELNEYNNIGRDINGGHGLLVFVNVMGQWRGLLFTLPEGNNSILGTGTDSTNTVNSTNTNNTDITNDENNSITNNINLAATSGDATATGNTHVGDVASGDARVRANVFNAIGSKLNFSNWFGVLFINVFGTWDGSFGVNTAAGQSTGGSGGGVPTYTGSMDSPYVAAAYAYNGSATGGGIGGGIGGTTNGASTAANATGTSSTATEQKQPLPTPKTPAGQSRTGIWILGGLAVALFLGLRIRDRIFGLY